MCGVIGYIGDKKASDVLAVGLKRMEYRGYDSAGIATHEKSGVKLTKKSGPVENLESALRHSPHIGNVGIGHTRWATHGAPTDENAHPHHIGKTTIIHNGIVENYEELKRKLTTVGYTFISETDTEVFAALIDSCYTKLNSPVEAVLEATTKVRGTYGLCVLFDDLPDTIVVARSSSPILIAQDGNNILIASDQNALAGYASQALVLNDNEIALCRPGLIEITNTGVSAVNQEILAISATEDSISKDDYGHFMQKEIHEQPNSVKRVLSGRINRSNSSAQLGGINLTSKQLRDVRSLLLVGCGTAYHAGLTAKYLLEPILKMPVQVEVASELRYRNIALTGQELAIAISQSGETADTIACVEELQLKGIPILGIINVVGSTIARVVDGGIYMHAGPEISVASTKAFTSQVVSLLLIGLTMARQRSMTPAEGNEFITALESLPVLIEKLLKTEKIIAKEAKRLAHLPHLMVLGRDTLYPIALEAALKVKEITYIPTSGYPGGEMKHGPIALLDENMGVVFFAGEGMVYEKSLSNLAEIHARGAQTLVFTDCPNYRGLHSVLLPQSHPLIQPLLFSIASQMLAYHMAVTLGKDIDKPKNLAKSVTVE